MPDFRLFGDEHVRQYEAADGKVGHAWNGTSVLILHTSGRKSGATRKNPLIYGRHDGVYAAVASKGGAPEHPLWYWNLVAEPQVELQDGTLRRAATAREVHGEERTRWWARAVEAYPDYADYQRRTGREIPVFVLE